METKIASRRASPSAFATKRASPVTSTSSSCPGDGIFASRDVIFRCFDVVCRSVDAIDGSTDDVSRTRDVVPPTNDRVDGSRDAVPRRRDDVDGSRDVVCGPRGRHFSVQRRRPAVDGRRPSNRGRRAVVGRRKIWSERRSFCVGGRLRSPFSGSWPPQGARIEGQPSSHHRRRLALRRCDSGGAGPSRFQNATSARCSSAVGLSCGKKVARISRRAS